MALSGTNVELDSRRELDKFIAKEKPNPSSPKSWIQFQVCKNSPEDKDNCIKIKESGEEPDPYDVVTEKLVASPAGYTVLFFNLNEEEKMQVKTSASVFLVLIVWVDDKGPVKQRMLYASSGQALTKLMQNKVKVIMQCNDKDDLKRSCIFEAIKSKHSHSF